jgi:hypothetical protein
LVGCAETIKRRPTPLLIELTGRDELPDERLEQKRLLCRSIEMVCGYGQLMVDGGVTLVKEEGASDAKCFWLTAPQKEAMNQGPRRWAFGRKRNAAK